MTEYRVYWEYLQIVNGQQHWTARTDRKPDEASALLFIQSISGSESFRNVRMQMREVSDWHEVAV